MREVENDLFGHDIALYCVSGQVDELKFGGTKNVFTAQRIRTKIKERHNIFK